MEEEAEGGGSEEVGSTGAAADVWVHVNCCGVAVFSYLERVHVCVVQGHD